MCGRLCSIITAVVRQARQGCGGKRVVSRERSREGDLKHLSAEVLELHLAALEGAREFDLVPLRPPGAPRNVNTGTRIVLKNSHSCILMLS